MEIKIVCKTLYSSKPILICVINYAWVMMCNTVPKTHVKIDCSTECDVIFCHTFAGISIRFYTCISLL